MSVGKTLFRAVWVLSFISAIGCVDERSFYISRNQIVTGTTCVPPTDSSGAFRHQGNWDVSGGIVYEMYPLVYNGLDSTSIDNQPERNNLWMREFRVELDLGIIPGEYPAELINFSIPVSGLIPPGAVAAFPVRVIPAELAIYLASVVPSGATAFMWVNLVAVADHNESPFESMAFRFPVEVCNGCLVTKYDTCPYKDDVSGFSSNPCNVAQDYVPVICCTTSLGLRTCNPDDFPAKPDGT